MNKFTMLLLGTLVPAVCLAQATMEKKDVRIYEHHSSDMNDGQPFGVYANGAQSGYDFINHQYYNSFNPSTFGAWGEAEVANIDMVEDQGPFGSADFTTPFGFTSGVSSIWGGDIKGNGLTVYAEAPATFNYDSAQDVAYIRDAFPGSASKAIEAVATGKVYLGKIRDTEMYVAIKITKARNIPSSTIPGMSMANAYFDFDYKYGTYEPTGIEKLHKTENAFSIVPNPSRGSFELTGIPKGLNIDNARLDIMDMTGRTLHTQPAASGKVSLALPAGNYILLLADGNNAYRSRLVITD